MANLATLRPPANDTTSPGLSAVSALRLDDRFDAVRSRMPGYIVGRILAAVRSGTAIKNGSVRRVTVDFLEATLPSTVNLEVVSSPMGAHGELSRFRLLQGTHVVARGAVVIDSTWPLPVGASARTAPDLPPMSEGTGRMRRDSDTRFYRFDASDELSLQSGQERRGGYIRFRDARAVNAQAIAELSDGWSQILESIELGSSARCTSVTLDFCVPLASRSWDRLRFLRVEQQSDSLIQGATIEHGSLSTYDGEQLAEFQRVVTDV